MNENVNRNEVSRNIEKMKKIPEQYSLGQPDSVWMRNQH